MSIITKRIAYGGWDNCLLLTDGLVEAVVTADVGPRVVCCNFVGEPNLFYENPAEMGLTGGDVWRTYGGHRLWPSPETMSRCYYPDNLPIEAETLPNGIHLRQYIEPNNGIEKEITIILDEKTHEFTVAHHLTNRNNWPVTLAPWALSVMANGGVGIVPQFRKADAEGLLPNRWLALWPYTDMNDSRATWGAHYIMLAHDARKTNPIKFGLSVPEGWTAYANAGYLFLKRFSFDPKAVYPDGGMNVEIYADAQILELESLGPLQTVCPGAATTHTEVWSIFRIPGSICTEADVERLPFPSRQNCLQIAEE